jgi:hypothetical protein
MRRVHSSNETAILKAVDTPSQKVNSMRKPKRATIEGPNGTQQAEPPTVPRSPETTAIESVISSQAQTISEDASDTTAVQNLPSLILGDQAGWVAGRLVRFFGTLVDSQLGISRCQNGDKTGSSAQGCSSSNDKATGSANSTVRGREKGTQRCDDQDYSSDIPEDEGGDNIRKKKHLKLDETPKERIACPFMKRYPLEFLSWRTCVGPGFDGIARMKYVTYPQ